MAKDLSQKFGQGISPQEFMGTMKANKEKFHDWFQRFSWEEEADQEFFPPFAFGMICAASYSLPIGAAMW